ncbi:hypothetical protein EZV73_07735 [Acidaminobacter sp. JC074]|uniref:C39 family peptidase n=1 Tax=Acidaminobacter sp. JC074 TaxID=2530199 RepID=UPI001F0FBFFB|nr:C39 family peptidase [Acidaminobacter sp. JC074]MCH4887457.1 hypothetical protein [Acidaminobacter sp. JC074]
MKKVLMILMFVLLFSCEESQVNNQAVQNEVLPAEEVVEAVEETPSEDVDLEEETKDVEMLSDNPLELESDFFGTYIIDGEDLTGDFEHLIKENDSVMLEDSQIEGTFVSPVFKAHDFIEGVVSWNVNTNLDNYVEVFIKVGTEHGFSDWMSYGKWSTDGRNKGRVSGQSDDYSQMVIDTVKLSQWFPGKQFQLKVVMSRKDASVDSPKLNQLTFTTQTLEKIKAQIEPKDFEIDVPELSQMGVEKIGSRICSPTSLTMLLNYYGIELTPEITANAVYDNGADIYGNWSYNMAFASEQGLSAHVQRCNNFKEVMDIVESKIPVAISIESDFQIENSPMAYPAGHLLVVRGFTKDNFVIVNDPASPVGEEVRRMYPLSQLKNAWTGYIYYLTNE